MSETSEQRALFDFLARMEGRYPLLAFVKHTPNEANGGGNTVTLRGPNGKMRNVPVEVLRNAQMGVKAGAWDIEYLGPNEGSIPELCPADFYRGLAIEMKAKNGRLSDEQKEWREHYRANGWHTKVCDDWTVAARLLLRWVGGNPDEVIGL